MPIRRLLPRRIRSFYVGHRSTIGFVVLFLFVLVSIALAKSDSNEQSAEIRANGQAAFRQIEASRVEQARASCVRTNRKILKVLRAQVRQQLDDIQRVPPAELKRLGFSRRELESRYRARLRLVAPVDCQALARRVSRTSPNFSP